MNRPVPPINPRQREHLQALAGGQRSAYPGLNMNVLSSLSKRKLVVARPGPGSMFCPKTGIMWALTRAGRSEINPAKAA
jgi:hypothetical protein